MNRRGYEGKGACLFACLPACLWSGLSYRYKLLHAQGRNQKLDWDREELSFLLLVLKY